MRYSSNNCGSSGMTPITDQARLETEIGDYYIGNSGEVNVSANGNGVILFRNPDDSNITVNINFGEYDNYSDANVKVYVSSFGYVDGSLKRSRLITSSLIDNSKRKSKAQILTGTDVSVKDTRIDRIFVLPRYNYKQVGTNGTIMLDPGESRIYQFTSLNRNSPAIVSITFEWWEQPISNTSSCN